MDYRIQKRIEKTSGLPFRMFPDEGISVLVSDARTDEPNNRLLIERVTRKNGVLITGIPRIVSAVTDCAKSMTACELFSPLGIAEIKRCLPPADAESMDETYGLNYALTEDENFHPVNPQYEVVTLRKKDIPPEQYERRMGERRPSETDDFIWAFACYHDKPDITATELAPFGTNCASIAVVFWEVGEEVAGFGLYTEEPFRGKGYALTVISAATRWILEQKAIAWYGTYSNNIPSLRIARRLGFSMVYQSFGA